MHQKPINYFSPYVSSHCFITSSWCIFHNRLSLKSFALLIQDWMITPKLLSCPKRSQKHHHSLFSSRDKYYWGWNMVTTTLCSILLAVHSSRARELQGTSFIACSHSYPTVLEIDRRSCLKMYHFSNKSFVHPIKFCLLPSLNQTFEVSAQNNLRGVFSCNSASWVIPTTCAANATTVKSRLGSYSGLLD